MIQSIGRGMRTAPGKSACTYIDFWDDDEAGIFRAHSRERLRVLKEEGFTVPAAPPREAPAGADEEIAPSWVHVPRTKKFLLIDGEGRTRAKAECVARDPVPPSYCRKCSNDSICRQGGRITWHADQA